MINRAYRIVARHVIPIACMCYFASNIRYVTKVIICFLRLPVRTAGFYEQLALLGNIRINSTAFEANAARPSIDAFHSSCGSCSSRPRINPAHVTPASTEPDDVHPAHFGLKRPYKKQARGFS